jgi:hypothetical protein
MPNRCEDKPFTSGPEIGTVRMSLAARDAADADEACRLVGRFRRMARGQGWTQEDIERACRGLRARRVVEQLTPHVTPTEREPVTWRTQWERMRDYGDGFRVLAADESVDFHPLRFLARGFRLALRGAKG